MPLSSNIETIESLSIDDGAKSIGTTILKILNLVEPKINIYQISEDHFAIEIDNISDEVKNVLITINKTYLDILLQVGNEFYIKENANIEDVSISFSGDGLLIKNSFTLIN